MNCLFAASARLFSSVAINLCAQAERSPEVDAVLERHCYLGFFS